MGLRESFPLLLKFFNANGVKVPSWIKPEDDCPWSTRGEFLAATKSEKMIELRDLLASTIQVQARFLVQRRDLALPKMLNAAGSSSQRAKIKANYERLAATTRGQFALVDYVNFKGEGTRKASATPARGGAFCKCWPGMGDSEGRVRPRSSGGAPRKCSRAGCAIRRPSGTKNAGWPVENRSERLLANPPSTLNPTLPRSYAGKIRRDYSADWLVGAHSIFPTGQPAFFVPLGRRIAHPAREHFLGAPPEERGRTRPLAVAHARQHLQKAPPLAGVALAFLGAFALEIDVIHEGKCPRVVAASRS